MNRAGLVSRERERPARFKTKRVFSFFALALPMLAVALLQITEVRGNVAPYVPRNAIEEGTYDNERLRTDKTEDDGERENEGSSVYLKISPIFDATRSHAGEYNTSRGEKRTMNRTRFKRGVVHLYNMVVCATGCNPLSYKGYGCYCGFLGSGYVIDGIDRCCKMHDWCYDATDCPVFMEYFVPYYWRCYRGNKPVCAVEHGNWGGSGSCAQRLCECDRSLAECLRRYPCPTTKAVCTSSPWRLVQNLFMIM